MAQCDLVATRGTCDRKHVGAVIVKDKRILSTGYNGSLPGLPHCLPGNGRIKLRDGSTQNISKLYKQFHKGEDIFVKSLDLRTEEVCFQKIISFFKTSKNYKWFRIRVAGTQSNRSMILSEDHKIYDPILQKYRESHLFKKGDLVRFDAPGLKEKAKPYVDLPIIEISQDSSLTRGVGYDIEVQETHNFFHSYGVLVSNCSDPALFLQCHKCGWKSEELEEIPEESSWCKGCYQKLSRENMRYGGHDLEDGHCVRTVHAEVNAIAQAAKLGIAIGGAVMYCNTRPCWNCLKTVVTSGIKEIIYRDDYGKQQGDRVEKTTRLLGFKLRIMEPSVTSNT
jgi:deoxycytidylate deaminase